MVSSPASNIPRRLGRYEIVGPLAAGGMAEVLLARLVGPSGFERPVVVKRILPHLARERVFVDMFLDEARIVAGIHHPNVVQVHELGREAGELYLVMEYLEGESVGSLLRRTLTRGETLDPRVGARIVADAAAGLAAAHELTDDDGRSQEIVHRDVSPQNVFITYDGSVKVLDFGVAKARDRSTVTEAGHLKGKFQYMSPEQCRGEPLDARSDIFSLGILLFEVTTGHRLFKRPSDMMVFKAICEEPIPSPAEIIEGYPAPLDAVCRRALARHRHARYATAADLRRDLLTALRELDEDPAPEAALRALMHRSFGERIEEKRELLRRVRAGSDPTRILEAEADAAVELPAATHADATLSTATMPATPRRGGRVAIGISASVALIVGAIGGAVALRTASTTASVGAPTSSVLAPLPSPAPTHQVESAAPSAPVATEVVVHVESEPPGARVLVGGVDRGAAPLDLRLPRSAEKVALELRRDGFISLARDLVPDLDQRLVLTLLPLRSAKKATPAVSSDPFHSFDR